MPTIANRNLTETPVCRTAALPVICRVLASLRIAARRRRGVSMLECVVVAIVAAGIVTYTIPMLGIASEQSRATEGFEFLRDVTRAQAEHFKAHGEYATEIDSLNLGRPTPVYFSVAPIKIESRDSNHTSWRLVIKREKLYPGAADYTIVFTEAGFDQASSTVDPEFMPQRIQ